ncbi:sugar kinase [Micromonospora sp. CA-259024]|uniref:sugar kinase n=1 Tax=Micromonospora sp. CA-259024 TaxID=3239965 RepID=UPI003D8DFD21
MTSVFGTASSGTGYDVVCVGESMALVVPDPPRPLCEGGTTRLDVAGAESNVAMNLAALGLRVAWQSRVGADPLGDLLTARIGATGVDVSLVEVDPIAPTGVFFKDPGPGGTTVHYYRRGSAAAAMDRSLWRTPELTGSTVLHLSGITAALSEACADLVSYALAERPVSGAMISFDVNFRPALWPVRTAGPVLAGLADQADLVLVGLDEAATLWGTRHPDEVRERLPGPGTLVVKDGSVGATSYGPGGSTFEPAPVVEVVEPVGAGDAFAAGYLYGLVRDLPERARLRLGHLVAAAALRAVGDLGELPPDTLVQVATRT